MPWPGIRTAGLTCACRGGANWSCPWTPELSGRPLGCGVFVFVRFFCRFFAMPTGSHTGAVGAINPLRAEPARRLGERELEIRKDLLDVPARLLVEQRDERLQRLDREPCLLEVARLGRELAVAERREQRARVQQEVGDLRLAELLDELLGADRLPRLAHPVTRSGSTCSA